MSITVTKIQNHDITYSSPKVQCQGSIWAPQLDFHEAETLLEGFAPQGVTAVYRPSRGPRAILILTFPTAEPPPRVTAGYLSFQVRLVIPKPRRCEKCQNYGHSIQRCRSTELPCGRCSGTGHSAKGCTNKVQCPACDGHDHESSSNRCPAWHYYTRINELVYGEKRDPRDARRIARAEFGIMVQPTAPQRRLSEDPPSPGDRDQFPPLQTEDKQSSRESTPTRPTVTDTVKKRLTSQPHKDQNGTNDMASEEEGGPGLDNPSGTKSNPRPKRTKDPPNRDTSPSARNLQRVVPPPTVSDREQNSDEEGDPGPGTQSGTKSKQQKSNAVGMSSTRCSEPSSDEEGHHGPWTQSGTKSRPKRPRVSPNRDNSPFRPRGRHGAVNLPTIERSASEPCEARGRTPNRTKGNTAASSSRLNPARRSTRGANHQQNQIK